MLTGWPGVNLAACDETPPQYGLELQGVLDGDGLEETYWVEGDGRKGRPARSRSRPADRIDSPDTGSVAEDRPKDEAQGEALLGRPSCLAVPNVAARSWAPVERIGDKKRTASARRVSPRVSRAVTSCAMSWRVTTLARGWPGPSRMSISSLARSRAGRGVGISCFFFGQAVVAQDLSDESGAALNPCW